jgi:multimeric flavodoxin WrbA
MKATIFNGSPRKNGNTATMTRYLVEKLRSEGAETKEYFLYHMNIKGCMNCGGCRTDDGLKDCAIKDDASGPIREFIASDLVIFASPVYMWHLTASLNAFIERLHSLCRYDGPVVNLMEGKRIAVAMTMGDDEYVAADAVNSLILFCDYFKMEYAGAFAVPFADKEQIERPIYQEKMRDFVNRILKMCDNDP